MTERYLRGGPYDGELADAKWACIFATPNGVALYERLTSPDQDLHFKGYITAPPKEPEQ